MVPRIRDQYIRILYSMLFGIVFFYGFVVFFVSNRNSLNGVLLTVQQLKI